MTTHHDIVALRVLADRYAQAVDRADGETYAQLFTHDGHLVTSSGEARGRAELIDVVQRFVRSRYDGTYHAVTTQVVDVQGNTATGETYCIARHFYRNPDNAHLCMEMSIRYQDKFQRDAGSWLFSRRRLITDSRRTFAVETLASAASHATS